MKLLIISLFLFICFGAYAQTARLTLTHPAPRAGEIIDVNYTISDKIDALPDNWVGILSLSGALTSGSIKIKSSASDTALTVGPFTFRINGKDYTSDSLTIQLAEPLPEQVEGVWIRKVKMKEQEYIIIEQRMPGTLGSAGKQGNAGFMEINPGEIEEPGISFANSGSHSTMDRIIIDGKEEAAVCFRHTIYKIEKTPEFKGVLRLRKKHFKNYPKGAELDVIIIE